MRVSLYQDGPPLCNAFSLVLGCNDESSDETIGISKTNIRGIDLLADNARSFIADWILRNVQPLLEREFLPNAKAEPRDSVNLKPMVRPL